MQEQFHFYVQSVPAYSERNCMRSIILQKFLDGSSNYYRNERGFITVVDIVLVVRPEVLYFYRKLLCRNCVSLWTVTVTCSMPDTR